MSRRSTCTGLAAVASVAVLGGLGSAVRAAAPQQSPNPAFVRVLIGFSGRPGPAEQAVVRAAGGQIRYAYTLVPAIAASVPEAALAGLANAPGVALVELDEVVMADDLELDNSWGVGRIGAGAVHALEPPITGSGVLVAVLDTGIDYTHPDLAANYRPDLSFDFVNNDDDPFDGDGHGSHVSGTIAAAYNGAGVVGVAPGASIIAVKVLDDLGSGYWSDVIAGLQWAVAHGAQVTNSSLGSGADPGTTVANAYAAAQAAGIVNVASAGNSGTCGSTGGKGGGSSGSVVGWPARYSSVIAVGATDTQDSRACFSSTGPEVELAAPGVNINSTVPTGAYAQYSGTSMASPHVAGAAALLIGTGLVADENGDGLINDDVREILKATALDLGAGGRDSSYGFGLVDAAAAVQYVMGEPPPPPPPPSGTVMVTGVSYASVITGSGKTGTTRILRITVSVVDGLNAPVAGASVSISLTRSATVVGIATGSTGTSGAVAFDMADPGNGCYTTQVTNVSAPGLTWNPTTTPSNSYCVGVGK